MEASPVYNFKDKVRGKTFPIKYTLRFLTIYIYIYIIIIYYNSKKNGKAMEKKVFLKVIIQGMLLQFIILKTNLEGRLSQ